MKIIWFMCWSSQSTKKNCTSFSFSLHQILMSSPPSDELTDWFSFSPRPTRAQSSFQGGFPYPANVSFLSVKGWHWRLSWGWGPIVCIGTCAASHMCLWMCDTILLHNSPFSSQLIKKLKMATRPVESLYVRYLRDWLSVSFLSSSYCDQIVVSIRSNFLRGCTL